MVVDTRPLITLSGQRIGWERAITHLLVLGQTGSGKSFIAQAILADIAHKTAHLPIDKRALLVACDPKSEDW